MKIYVKFLFLFLFCSIKIIGQNKKKVILEFDFSRNNKSDILIRESPYIFLDSSHTCMIPKSIKNYKLLRYNLQNFDSNLDKQTRDSFNKFSTLYVLINVNEDSSRYLIPDLNNNKNFTDDPILPEEYIKANQLNKKDSLCFLKTLNHKYYDVETKFFIPKVFEFYFLLDKVSISPVKDKYCYAELNQKGLMYRTTDKFLQYQIEFGSWNSTKFDKSWMYLEFFKGSNSENIAARLKEPFVLNNKIIEIDSIRISNKKIYLSQYEIQKKRGNNVGLFAPILSAKDIRTDQKVHLNTQKNNNYKLLDFWGTWCGPCKELTPNLILLKKVNDSLKLPFNHISIASDKNIDEVKNYIKDTKFNWTTVFDDRINTKNSIAKLFNVVAFPTFIIIDKKGKIIFREFGIPGFYKMKEFIQKKKIWD